ncbi:hypothetical protein CXF85_12015 [Colwellia sp. 75C3]|uniref:hypothetical protein n=1 Tax=Colwellia sp. 75C3 TaxID=888425 RepID=UPI000C32D81F|nr:hypothetical protein [Colwellia sp. 75C3]PKG83066.1 hypothetical protein CXF85_12015 [Colwellia sp. 75C3]
MLTIRQAQIDLMMIDKQQNIALTMGLHLQNKHPAIFQFYNETQMQVWVSRQLNDLTLWNFFEKENIEAIIEIIALLGERFERCEDTSWAFKIIEDNSSTETIRRIKLQRASKNQLNGTI